MARPSSATTPLTFTRRTAIGVAGTGAAGAALVLSGCAPTAPGGSGSGSGDGETLPGSPTRVASVSDIPVGGTLAADAGGTTVLLSQPTEGEVLAFSSVCTHQGCAVAAQAAEFACPCHSSVFDISTGEPTSGPALEALPQYTVTLEGDDVLVSAS